MIPNEREYVFDVWVVNKIFLDGPYYFINLFIIFDAHTNLFRTCRRKRKSSSVASSLARVAARFKLVEMYS